MIIPAAVLGEIYEGVGLAHGADPEEAEIFRACLLRADLRGHSTQGSALLPYHDEMLASGQMRFGAGLELVSDAPSVGVVDAHFGAGEVVATRSMEIAIRKAERTGLGCVAVRNSGDFAMASAYSLQALDHGMIGIAMSNGKPVVAPWGGRDPLLCTNPISVAFPGGTRYPIVIDMATSAFSMGDAIRTARDGGRLPFPGIVDPHGEQSDDPAKIVVDVEERESKLDGALLPLGPKGFGMSLIVELMCSALAGAYGSWSNDYEPTGERPWRHGHCLLALDPQRFGGLAEFTESADALIDALESSAPAAGGEGVRLPGRSAHEEELRRTSEGVPVRDEELRQLLAVARRRGLGGLADAVGG
jgi:L-2-hydroxycarboxylate dehydrogenase (NAD+)